MLWESHPATGRQRRRYGKPTQREIILELLRQSRARGESLPLPKIQETRIAQFTARLFELRRLGFVIENELKRIDGTVHSSYRLTHDPERDGAQQ